MSRIKTVIVCITLKALMFIATPIWAEGEVLLKQYDDGSVYQGTFKNGVRHGFATYTSPDGFSYTGEWINGEIEGQGKAKYPNGSIYTGKFSKSEPNGIGKIEFIDGGNYEGEWLNGIIQGTGTAKYSNGSIYVGEFKEAKQHGQGDLTTLTGIKYSI